MGRCLALSSDKHPRRIDAILKDLVSSRTSMQQQLRRHEIFLRWDDIVGRSLAAKLVPIRVRKRELVLGASSSTWAQEASMMQREILKNIRRMVGPGVVDDLRVRVGIPAREEEDEAAREAGEVEEPEICLSPPHQAADMDLIDRAERLRRADEKIRDWRREQGWPKCEACGERFPPDMGDETCPICLRERAVRHEGDVWRALEDAPWMSVRRLRKETGAPEKVCRRVRNEVYHFWQSRITEGVQLKQEGRKLPDDFRRRILQVVSMCAGRRQPELNRASVERSCGSSAAELYFSR